MNIVPYKTRLIQLGVDGEVTNLIKIPITAVAVVLTLFSGLSLAGQYEDAMELMNKNKHKQAVPLFRALAQKDDPRAQFALVTALSVAHEDYPERYEWLVRSANQGYVEAETELGIWTIEGYMKTKYDLDKALYWLKRAGRKGSSRAQYKLALYYLIGQHNVTISPKESAKWYRKHLRSAKKPWVDYFQKLMKREGYYFGPVDGVVGRKMLEALDVMSNEG